MNGSNSYAQRQTVANKGEVLFQEGLPTLFFALTQDLSRAYYLKADLIKDCPLVEVHNRYVGKGEMFYDVPITMFKIADLTQQF